MLLLTDKPLDALRYLYDRLNIIDRKAGVTLRFSVTVLSFVVAFGVLLLREQPATTPLGQLLSDMQPWLKRAMGAIVVFAGVAAALAFCIGRLRFDYVTALPFALANLHVYWDTKTATIRSLHVHEQTGRGRECPGQDHAEQLAKFTPNAGDRRWWSTYSREEWSEVLDRLRSVGGGGKRRSIYAFEESFFSTIIARERMLAAARVFSGMALFIYFCLLVVILWRL